MNSIFLRVSLQEKVLFCKNMALAIKSGISLVNSLKMIKNQTRSKSLSIITGSLIEDTNKGIFLSAGLSKFKEVFGELFINIIKIAETSGTLPENLIYLGDELKKKHELRKKVRGALVYPTIILIATLIIATGMIVFVFPKILPLFNNFKGTLPFTTRMLIKGSDLITNYGLYILGGLVLLIVGLRLVLKVKPIRFVYNRILLSLPIAGNAIMNFNMANFSRTLAILLRSGVQITEALNITSATLVNLVYKREIDRASEHIRKGEFLSKYLYTSKKIFPHILVNMIEVGENTGNLTENLVYLAEYYEGEVDDFVKNLSNILEPMLLLVMGGVVGFIALSFITPIYQLTRAIK